MPESTEVAPEAETTAGAELSAVDARLKQEAETAKNSLLAEINQFSENMEANKQAEAEL